jgi:hypothetical protein
MNSLRSGSNAPRDVAVDPRRLLVPVQELSSLLSVMCSPRIGIRPSGFLSKVFSVGLPGGHEGGFDHVGPRASKNAHRSSLCDLIPWILVHELPALSLRPELKAAERLVFKRLMLIGRTCRNEGEISSALWNQFSDTCRNRE